MTSACRETPTPALPRKRERGRSSLVSSSSLYRLRDIARSGLPSSLSRLRGRVARSLERDGWGPTRVRWSIQTFAEAT